MPPQIHQRASASERCLRTSGFQYHIPVPSCPNGTLPQPVPSGMETFIFKVFTFSSQNLSNPLSERYFVIYGHPVGCMGSLRHHKTGRYYGQTRGGWVHCISRLSAFQIHVLHCNTFLGANRHHPRRRDHLGTIGHSLGTRHGTTLSC